MSSEFVDTTIRPTGRMGVLSRTEINKLLDTSHGGLYEQFRNCSLAVLNCGSDSDDSRAMLEKYRDFRIEVTHEERGIKLGLFNAPSSAFVDNRLIRGIGENLFAVLRDILFVHEEINTNPDFELQRSDGITDAVFHILRNADVTEPQTHLRMIVCWGGHSISRNEYEYTKEVGYQMGLRGLDISTGCGPGAMKGPMKGAAIGHSKQRILKGRYLGITEPGIIAAESPNPIVNNLVILPDIEKRLEAFVRVGHGIVVFPGGVGTAEEILYLLGILMHPENADMPFPLIFTGPAGSASYFTRIDEFIRATLGDEATSLYRIIIDDPVRVAAQMRKSMMPVRASRLQTHDAFYFNWRLKIPLDFQTPFSPTHENVAGLRLSREIPGFELAADLRRAFSAIVAGNIKEEGIRAIEQNGKYQIRGERQVLEPLDQLLQSFVRQNRMKIEGDYVPCYTLVR